MPRLLPAIFIAAAFSLSACDSAEERAEGHYQSALDLLESGEEARALVELRNVFDLDEDHREALALYAEIQRNRGEISEAYAHYLRLAEFYPEDGASRRALAEIAFSARDWQETERHMTAGIALLPADPSLQTLQLAVQYRHAATAADQAAVAEVLAQLTAMIADDPTNQTARQVVIGHYVATDQLDSALPLIEDAIALDETAFTMHLLKLQILVDSAPQAAVEEQLLTMFRLFPDDPNVQGTLINWYESHNNPAAAEAMLRELAARSDDASGRIAVVNFLNRTQGPDAALAELDALIAAQPDAAIFKAMKASIRFESGEADAALTDFAALLADADDSDNSDDIRVTYATALEAAGQPDAARREVDQVLAADSGHVGALKLQAHWLTEGDRPDDAILALRKALDQAPQDPEILMLMADAHLRAGSYELAGERLSLAVEMSNRAPRETLRYARYLQERDRALAAESIIIDALRLQPKNIALLRQLGSVYLQLGDTLRGRDVANRLSRLGEDTLANSLSVNLLLRERDTAGTVRFAEELMARGADGTAGLATIVRAHITAGDFASAAAAIDEVLASTPDNSDAIYLRAGVHAIEGEVEEAIALYETLLQSRPDSSQIVRAYFRLLSAEGRVEDASRVLAVGLAASPDDVDLRFTQARHLEQTGDFDGAISAYEALYAANSENLLFANNLANLLSTHKGDPAAIERAYAIARRLRGSTIPAFQDTYGWIAYQRGDYEEAVTYLEQAAQALSGDNLVQMRLGLVYAALGRSAEARTLLETALTSAGDRVLPQTAAAQDILATLPEGGVE